MSFVTQGKTNWKFIIIVVIIAAIVGGGIWCWQKNMPQPEGITILPQDEIAGLVPSEVEGWQTYKNEEYGFEIKYPLDFEYNDKGQIVKDSWLLLNFLASTPIENSLDNYLEFNLDKSGKDMIQKSKKTFGDAEEGISYTARLMPSDCLEVGFIFNHGQFTYHFWADDCHAKADLNLFLDSLATIKFIDNLPKISVREIGKVRIYKNENYEIEFKYPIEWGSLALKSITQDNNGNKIYHFLAGGELISKVYYHQPSDMVAFVKEGEKCTGMFGGNIRQDILQVYKDEKIKTLYTVSLQSAAAYEKIYNVDFSPNGKYIYFDIPGYEWSSNGLLDVDSGLNILKNYNVLFSSYKDVYWSPNNEVLTIRSYQSDLGGEGTDGLFVSDHDNTDKLNEIFSFKLQEHISGSNIYNIYFSDDYELFFTVLLKECSYEGELVCKPEKIIMYKYNAKIGELKEISE